MAEKKKVTFKVALFGALGLGSLAYAYLRRPRYLYDGMVQACEGPTTLSMDKACVELAMTRGNGSGKIIAPFDGVVTIGTTSNGKTNIVINHANQPVSFGFEFDRGTPALQAGASFKAGDLIGQAESVLVRAHRIEGASSAPMSPSAWLIANAMLPASTQGSAWCEDSHQVIVPACEGVTFRAPTLPKYSLRTVRMTM